MALSGEVTLHDVQSARGEDGALLTCRRPQEGQSPVDAPAPVLLGCPPRNPS